MVKYHTDSERGNLLPPHGLLFPSNSKGSFICTIPQTGLHIPQPLLHQSWLEHWLEREIAQWVGYTQTHTARCSYNNLVYELIVITGMHFNLAITDQVRLPAYEIHLNIIHKYWRCTQTHSEIGEPINVVTIQLPVTDIQCVSTANFVLNKLPIQYLVHVNIDV